MAGNADGLFPCGNIGRDALDQNRRTEHGAVKYGSDGAVGRLPHLLEIVFAHSRRVGGNGSALDRNAVFPGGFRTVEGHLIVGFVAVNQTEIVILRLEIDIGINEYVLDHLPDDAGHFVAVHLDKRRFHLNFFHRKSFLCFDCYQPLRTSMVL